MFLSMAKNVVLNYAPVPFNAIEEANDDKIVIESHPQLYDNLIKDLPVKLFCRGQLRLYQGVWIWENILRGTFTMKQNFQSRPTDIFLASHPKSGDYWLKALLFAIMTRSATPLHQNPLLTHDPDQCIPNIDDQFATGRSSLIEAIPSPRILSTNLPYSLLPNSITHSDCPIIYICRHPKDVSVFMYHDICELYKEAESKPSFEEVFKMLCDGVSGFGPLWDHVLGYWQEHLKRPEKILFLKYEDLLQGPTNFVKRLAEFINHPFSDEEQKKGSVEQIMDLIGSKKLKDLKVNETGEINKYASTRDFYIKSVVGDRRNHMTPEMAQKLDDLVEEKFRGSGLEICAMSSSATPSTVE